VLKSLDPALVPGNNQHWRKKFVNAKTNIDRFLYLLTTYCTAWIIGLHYTLSTTDYLYNII